MVRVRLHAGLLIDGAAIMTKAILANSLYVEAMVRLHAGLPIDGASIMIEALLGLG